MTTQTEALKLALETLESSRIFVTSQEKIKHPEGTDCYDERILAIKEALSEPEQEPVAWMNDSTPSGIFARHIDGARNFGCTIPLYTTPPQRKPLSEEEINEIAKNYALNNSTTPFHFARAIEAAHNIKE